MSSPKLSPTVLREYRPEDFLELCRLDGMCFSEAVAYSPEEIALRLAEPGAFATVAEWEKQVVAFVLASVERRGLGHVVTIDVHPEFRREGIGDRLMHSAEEQMKKRGARRVILEVAIHNEAAIAFYEKHGVVRRRLLRRYYYDATDAFLMEKKL
jgi:ribosomal-protein-alanine N-acetyltransferase